MFLGARISQPMNYKTVVKQRIAVAQSSFNSLKIIFCRPGYPISLKRHLFNLNPAVNYIWIWNLDAIRRRVGPTGKSSAKNGTTTTWNLATGSHTERDDKKTNQISRCQENCDGQKMELGTENSNNGLKKMGKKNYWMDPLRTKEKCWPSSMQMESNYNIATRLKLDGSSRKSAIMEVCHGPTLWSAVIIG